jgi:hypothetical protein
MGNEEGWREILLLFVTGNPQVLPKCLIFAKLHPVAPISTLQDFNSREQVYKVFTSVVRLF